MSTIRLSIVITVVDGESSLRSCLQALEEQNAPPVCEVIVPFDSSIGWAAQFASEFPEYIFLSLGDLVTERPIKSPLGQHELYDKRRTAGLNSAVGEIIAIIEDRCVANPDWAASIDRLHRLPHAAIGGAVECGVDRILNWAIYFCDFGRYQLPFRAGTSPYLTDVNISYKRTVLTSIRDLWKVRYHETTVNWALKRRGETLFLTPELIVRQMRGNLRLMPLLHERIHWGRLYAYTRARESTISGRILLAGLTPFLPLLLFARLVLHRIQKQRQMGTFVCAAPTIVLLLLAWSFGEFIGYTTGRP